MPEHQSISAMTAGDEIRSVYLINQASLQQSRNGPYWRLEFKDASGVLEAKIWSPLSLSFPALLPGQMAEVSGRTSVYRDQLQLTVEAMRVLDEEEAALLPMENYLPSSERPAADMLADIEALCDEVFTHKPWKKFVRSVFSDKRLRPLLLRARLRPNPCTMPMRAACSSTCFPWLGSVCAWPTITPIWTGRPCWQARSCTT